MPRVKWLVGDQLKVTGKRKHKSGGPKPLTPVGMKHVQTVKTRDGPGSRTRCRICGAPVRVDVKRFTNEPAFVVLDLDGLLHVHQDG